MNEMSLAASGRENFSERRARAALAPMPAPLQARAAIEAVYEKALPVSLQVMVMR
jgi:hypothetical protein